MLALLWRIRALALALPLAACAAAVWLADPVVLQTLRLAQFDQFQRWHPRERVAAAVKVVDIDEAALKAFGQWPWPRTRLAELIQRLDQAGAAAIALDVLLAEPDRTTPAEMARLWGDPRASQALHQLPDHDALLASSLAGRPVVIGQSLLPAGIGQAASAPVSRAAPYRMVLRGELSPQAWLSGFGGAVAPLPAFAAAAAGIGAVNAAVDPDGIVRRVPLLLRNGDELVPGLSAEALRVAQGERNYLIQGGAAGVREIRIGQYAVPTSARAELWIHYPDDATRGLVSARRILEGAAALPEFRGAVVLVGSSAEGLMDIRSNPMGQRMPGVMAHALALEQVLTGQYLQRPGWASGAEALVLFGGALLVGLIGLASPVRTSATVLCAAIGAILGGAWFGFTAHGLLLDAVNPALAILLTFGLTTVVRHRHTEREQRWLRNAFARYVSPNRVNHLVAHPEALHLGGQRQVCSFVFTDLAGFTSLMEAGDPAQAVGYLNDYLEGMLAIAFRHEGTLDRIVGDAVAVLFSAPEPQPDHRRRALACALEMDAFATAYALKLQAQGVKWGMTRIGVHSGEVIVGNFGGRTMFDYRALGDPINTAARLESVNKHLGTRMCVSAAVISDCPGVAVRRVGRLVLKGKSLPLEVFTPEACLPATGLSPASDYEAALVGLAPGPGQNLDAGARQFGELAAAYPEDPLVALHRRRLRAGSCDDLIVLSEK